MTEAPLDAIAAILDRRRIVAAVNRAIAELRDVPALTAAVVAARAAQRLKKPVDDELRNIAAERLKAKFGRPRAMSRRRVKAAQD
jgi:hypothetical protein